MSDQLKELSPWTTSESLNKACISRLMLLFKTSSMVELTAGNSTGQSRRPSGVAAGVVPSSPGSAPVGKDARSVVSQEGDVAPDVAMALDVSSMSSAPGVTSCEDLCPVMDPGAVGNPSTLGTAVLTQVGLAVETGKGVLPVEDGFAAFPELSDDCSRESPPCEEARQAHRSPRGLGACEGAKQLQRSPPKPPTRRGWHSAIIALKLVGFCEGKLRLVQRCECFGWLDGIRR